MSFLLASASPRRRALLASVGLEPKVQPSNVDESVQPQETPLVYVRRVAEAKALAAPDGQSALAADTVVALDGQVLGKPQDDDEAKATLQRLSGRWHTVHTAIALRHGDGLYSRVVSTQVRFRVLEAADIARYVATEEARDKAGAYGIQGEGGALVAEVKGSYTNVVGLPVDETLALLGSVGLVPPTAER